MDLQDSMMKRLISVFFCGLVFVTLLNAADFQGSYRNSEYGYSIEIPAELKGSADPPPAPQHGVRIPLTDSGQSFLWVDGSFNSNDARSASEVLEDVRTDIESKAKIESVFRSKTHLGALPAASISIRYVPRGSHSIEFRQETVALRNETGPGIIYTVGMIVPADLYAAKHLLLDSVIRSFRIEPLPH
jgi:hypothetical protein